MTPPDNKPLWREIVGFSKYQVSSNGEIRGLKGKILKLRVNRNYLTLNLWHDTERKCYARTVHRLVAEAFIPNPKKKSHINHINGVKTDNHIENLEWCTHQENMDHAKAAGRFRSLENNPATRFSKETALKIRQRCDAGENMSAIAREYGVTKTTIHKIHRRESWKTL